MKWSLQDIEILKAGVMKYGLNKWSKISSLLNKPAIECKDKFYSVCNKLTVEEELKAEEMKNISKGVIARAIGVNKASIIASTYNVNKEDDNINTNNHITNDHNINILDMVKARLSNKKNRKQLRKEKLLEKSKRRACKYNKPVDESVIDKYNEFIMDKNKQKKKNVKLTLSNIENIEEREDETKDKKMIIEFLNVYKNIV